jgi:hypothetical protein
MEKNTLKNCQDHPAYSSDNPGSYVISGTEGPDGSIDGSIAAGLTAGREKFNPPGIGQDGSVLKREQEEAACPR